MYYYFAASLPFLEFGVKCPTCLENFLEQSERLLPERDRRLIEQALLIEKGQDIKAEHRVIAEWQNFMQDLRNQWVLVRAGVLKKDPLSYMRGSRTGQAAVVEVINQAQKAEDPLSGEKLIDQLRWDKLEDIGQGHFFDLDFLLVYALKLQILKRLERIDSVHGEHTFQEYCTTASRLR